MARAKVRLDRRGIEDLLKSHQMDSVTEHAAEAVAQNVRSQGIQVEGEPGAIALPVEVTMRTTDRAHANVTITHPSGIAVQAKHGALTKAAAQAGLDVKGG